MITMKKIFLFLTVFSVIFFASCGGEKEEKKEDKAESADVNYPKTPEDVVRNFITSWYEMNYDEAGKYYDGDFSDQKDMDEKMGKKKEKAYFIDLKSEITGETAVVTYFDTINEVEGTIDLIKVKDLWKVQGWAIQYYSPASDTSLVNLTE